jgi:hypothetical protein
MQSPFPGMDPYLEMNWRDVHNSLCTYARDLLQPQLRPALLARIDERLMVETEIEESRSIYPEVSVVQKFPRSWIANTASATGVAEPLRIEIPDDPAYDGYVQIIDPRNGYKVITVIEFLSISNKTLGKGADQYREKQQESIDARISIVEIDLLRAGPWVLKADEERVPAEARKPYRGCVRRAWENGVVDYYHFSIQKRLPKIRIPLRQGDSDAILDLQELIDRTYENGGYDSIDYSIPPIPALDAETAAWAQELIARRNTQ